MELTATELDQRQSAYKTASDAWKQAIQHEEDLASVEHSLAKVDEWEQASFHEEDLRRKAKDAKLFYEDGLRSEFFGFHGK